MEIEVKVTLKNLEDLEAEIAKMVEKARAEMKDGVIEADEAGDTDNEPESEVEPAATVEIEGVEHKVLGKIDGTDES